MNTKFCVRFNKANNQVSLQLKKKSISKDKRDKLMEANGKEYSWDDFEKKFNLK